MLDNYYMEKAFKNHPWGSAERAKVADTYLRETIDNALKYPGDYGAKGALAALAGKPLSLKLAEPRGVPFTIATNRRASGAKELVFTDDERIPLADGIFVDVLRVGDAYREHDESVPIVVLEGTSVILFWMKCEDFFLPGFPTHRGKYTYDRPNGPQPKAAKGIPTVVMDWFYTSPLAYQERMESALYALMAVAHDEHSPYDKLYANVTPEVVKRFVERRGFVLKRTLPVVYDPSAGAACALYEHPTVKGVQLKVHLRPEDDDYVDVLDILVKRLAQTTGESKLVLLAEMLLTGPEGPTSYDRAFRSLGTMELPRRKAKQDTAQ